MNTHQAITEVPTGPSHAIFSQSAFVGLISAIRPERVDIPTASITVPAITNRRSDNTSGDTPHSRVSADPMTKVDAKPMTDNAARIQPINSLTTIYYTILPASG